MHLTFLLHVVSRETEKKMCFCLNLNILKLKGNHEVNSNSYSNFASADSLKNALWKAYLNVCSLKELQRLNLFVANSLIKNVTQLCCGRLIKFFSPPTSPCEVYIMMYCFICRNAVLKRLR